MRKCVTWELSVTKEKYWVMEGPMLEKVIMIGE